VGAAAVDRTKRVGAAAVDRTLTALADPHRRRVLELLHRRPRRAGELARAAGLSPPAMSRHLRVLREHGLVEEARSEDDARCRIYRLRAGPLRELQHWLGDLERFWDEQLAAFKQHAEGKRTR